MKIDKETFVDLFEEFQNIGGTPNYCVVYPHQKENALKILNGIPNINCKTKGE